MKKPKIDREKLRIFILDIFHGGREYQTTADYKRTPFPLKAVALFACATVLILTLIFSIIKITDISAEIASLRRQTVSLSAKKMSLENELDHRYSFAEIIEEAEALGFAENGGRVVYIETTNSEDAPEETENTEEETAEEDTSDEE
ncbi:MAG: hypothetical protein IJ489_08610 [Clostridia bacterium]|nr:hypothetical protein [Clostridia bacterium]